MVASIDFFGLIEKPALDQPAFGRVHGGIVHERITDSFKLCLDPAAEGHGMRGLIN